MVELEHYQGLSSQLKKEIHCDKGKEHIAPLFPMQEVLSNYHVVIRPCNFLIVVLVIKWLFNMDFVNQKLNIHSEAAEEALRLIRSERHEFVNHLHSVYGLMVTGEHEEAAQYLKNVGTDCRFNSRLLSIPNAPLRVLLENKRDMASARGIAFTLEVQSDMNLFHMGSKDITTVFGNILDNAIAAVTEHDNNTQKEIKFTIVETSGSYHFSIMNSGPAIDEKIAGKMFEDGFSTKGNYRGYGLALVRKTVNSYGGRVLYTTSLMKAFYFYSTPYEVNKDFGRINVKGFLVLESPELDTEGLLDLLDIDVTDKNNSAFTSGEGLKSSSRGNVVFFESYGDNFPFDIDIFMVDAENEDDEKIWELTFNQTHWESHTYNDFFTPKPLRKSLKRNEN